MHKIRALLIAGLIALFFIGCSSFLYHPLAGFIVKKEDIPLKIEDVYFKTEDGVKLHGWYFHNKAQVKPKSIFLFFHGNAQNLSYHAWSLAWLLDMERDFFIFDYRGFGKSESSEPNPETVVKDGAAAFLWIKQRAQNVPVVLFAQSLGVPISLVSLNQIEDRDFIKLAIMDSGFLSYKKVAQKVLSRAWLTWPFQWLSYLVLSDDHAPRYRIEGISPIPLVVMHGDQDQTVDYTLGQDLYQQALEPKEFWLVPEGRHIDGFFRHNGAFEFKLLQKLNFLGL